MNGRLMHAAAAMLTIASLIVSPVFAETQNAQSQSAQDQQSQAPPPQQAQPPSQPAPASSAPTSAPGRDLRLTDGPDYSTGKRAFPNLIAPYTERYVPAPMLTNTPKIDQLIQDGKLMLSLDDAISLSLENNLNISIQRYTPWIAETQLLLAKAGGVPQSGSTQQVVLGSGPAVSFDPVVTAAQCGWSHGNVPVNNPFTSGTGTTSILGLTENFSGCDIGYSQGFHTGTNLAVALNLQRSTTNSPQVFFNPALSPTLTATLTQPLLNGFGFLPNTRYIIEAKHQIKIANSQFAQQIIATVTQTSNDYWELVYDRGNVKVEEAAVAVSQKLYEDNKKQLEIGTMAPLDVLTAESQLASDQQALIVAQTTKLQQETVLLNDIAKSLLAKDLAGVEIIPTTAITNPEVVENVPLADAVQEAWRKRPELFQVDQNLQIQNIEVRATKNALLPSLNAYVQYEIQGLNGNAVNINQTATAFAPDLNAPLLYGSGAPVLVGGLPVYGGTPTTFNTTETVTKGGLGGALTSMFENNYPTYSLGVNLTLPLRNRAAQANNARAQLDERQLEVQKRQTENTIVLNVRNALIALQQYRAQVTAAEKARVLAQQTLDAEQKKYQLGSSTSYQVVLRSRDLTTAQGTALRAQANLQEALVNFNQAMGRTLEVNNIQVSKDIFNGAGRTPLIPGTPDPSPSYGKK
ncbi:MAG: TolC family protein [Candidatus Acidiferrales bacterium]